MHILNFFKRIFNIYLELNQLELKYVFKNTLAFRIMQSQKEELIQHINGVSSLCDTTDKVQLVCARMEAARGHKKPSEL